MMWQQARRRSIVIEGEKRTSVGITRGRLSVLSVFFVVAYLLMAFRLVDLAIVQGEMARMDKAQDNGRSQIASIAPRRGDIFDRHGFLVATTLKIPSLYVDPSLVLDADDLYVRLNGILPDLSHKKVLATLHASNRFGWVKRGITPEQQQKILELGEPSLGFQYEYKRVYPQKALFAHIVGYTDRDGLGLSGVERGYDDVLSKGQDVHLSVDLRLQHVVKREVSKAMADFTAKAGSGIILDVHTGEVLAGVSLPDFDLNMAKNAKDREKFNRLTLGVYELGSMFKIFSTAAYLEMGKGGVAQKFDARKPLKTGRFRISDYHAQKRIMTLPEVFIHSSNIGSALMGQDIGGKALKHFYSDLGLLTSMDLELKEVGRPLVPNPWRASTTLTASYGHGLSTTPLQMTAAVASIVNGGTLSAPTLIRKTSNTAVRSEVRVISEKTSEIMRRLLRLTVTKGTGKNADVDGYMIGGKTGTAEKSVGGRYHRDKLISSFVGAFPMNDPRYVLMVMVDEPKGNKKSYGYATAGWVAAPAIKRIVGSMASILGLPADRYEQGEDIGDALMSYIHEKKKGGKKLVSY
ncbi:MAG: peptidoglycan D,D-transpeptidase FtsI family protein [Alphaproteobacteria bacterium]